MPFAIAGQSGSVILFVSAGVGLVIVGGYFVALAARSYLVVVQGTAVGLDAVEWPDEAPIDWFGQALAVVGQLLLWIMPAGFAARFLATAWLPDDAPLRFTLLIGLAVWLLFPVGFLLTMAADQAASTAGRLLASLPSLLLFYVLSGLVLALALGMAYVGVFTPAGYALPVAAVLGPAALLIHARLVGRVGYLIGRREVALGKPKKKKKRKRVPTVTTDPWAEPEDDEVIEAEETVRPASQEPEADPYTVSNEAVAEPPREDAAVAPEALEREVRLRRREDPVGPKSVFFAGVWEFPLYPTTHRAWVWLAVFGLMAGGIARFMVSVSPFGGGG